MPDNPIDKPGNGPNPEDKLRDLFDKIEQEESSTSRTSGGQLPPDETPHIDSDFDLPGLPDVDLSADELRLRELEEELEEVRAHRAEEEGEIRSEFDQRMSDLDAKIKKMRSDRSAQEAQRDKKFASDASASRGLGLGLTIAYTFIGLPLVGALIGWAIDRSANTTIYKGVFMMVGAAAGLALTVMFLNRANSQK